MKQLTLIFILTVMSQFTLAQQYINASSTEIAALKELRLDYFALVRELDGQYNYQAPQIGRFSVDLNEVRAQTAQLRSILPGMRQEASRQRQLRATAPGFIDSWIERHDEMRRDSEREAYRRAQEESDKRWAEIEANEKKKKQALNKKKTVAAIKGNGKNKKLGSKALKAIAPLGVLGVVAGHNEANAAEGTSLDQNASGTMLADDTTLRVSPASSIERFGAESFSSGSQK